MKKKVRTRPPDGLSGWLLSIIDFEALRGSHLGPTDRLCVGFLIFLTMICAAFAHHIPRWALFAGLNMIWVGLIVILERDDRHRRGAFLVFLRDWYVLALLFYIFKELYFIIPAIHGHHDYDSLLIGADRWVFGIDPTRFLSRFAHPLITEILQISYALFFLNFLLIGLQLYKREDHAPFHQFVFVCAFGFFISYLAYFLLPAVGPRFTLHDFTALDTDLPGLWLTPYLRRIMDWGDSIPRHATRELAAMSTQRDVFPSGHTMMTLVAMHMAYKFRISLRHFVAGSGALLLIATVYLRYHYLVDLAAGGLLAALCIVTWPAMYDRLVDRLRVH